MLPLGLLYNPALFTGKHLPVWSIAQEYLNYCVAHPPPMSFVRGHLFKMFVHFFNCDENAHLRSKLGEAKSLDEMIRLIGEIGTNCLKSLNCDNEQLILDQCTFPVPAYLCQPHFRSANGNKPNETTDQTSKNQENIDDNRKRKQSDDNVVKKVKVGRTCELCTNQSCKNPRGLKCDHLRCRTCCKQNAITLSINCSGHKFVYNKQLVH